MKNPNDINVKEYCDNKIKNAKNAFKVLETYSQKQVDTLAKICAKVVYDNAEELAKDACAETKMGVVADKIAKNKNKAKLVWWSLKHKKSVGIIDENKTLGIKK
jgi:succinate-semialdehyde dehydrogenase